MEERPSESPGGHPLRASERFAALIGIPTPPWTVEDEARFQAKMAEADADLFARIERRNTRRSVT